MAAAISEQRTTCAGRAGLRGRASFMDLLSQVCEMIVGMASASIANF
jgi:hypothetical protein